MNSIFKLAMLVSMGAIAPFLSQQSRAADAAQPSDDALTTIVVTAEKREEQLKDVPMSITALGGGSLDKLQDRSFSDYAAMVPGLSLVSGDSGLTRLTLRGQNAGGDGSTVAVYLDESPFGSSNALLNGSVLSGDFDTWDLQRIEVLRGPQGTLYGANSEGGLLKFVTTAPVLGSFSGAVETTGEAVARGGNGGDVRAVLNLPLGDKLAFRISGFDQDVPGYINDPLTGQDGLNDGHKYGGRVSLLAAPTDDLTIRVTSSQQQSRYNGSNSVDIDPVTLQPAHGDLSQERFIPEPSSFKYENNNVTINWNAGPFSILSTTSYGVLNSDTVRDATSTLLQPPATTTYGELLSAVLGQPLGAYIDNAADLKKFTEELRLSSAPSDRLEWQVGGYFTRETGLLDQHLNGFTNPGGSSSSSIGTLEFVTLASTYKESAGFGNLTYHFNSQFDIQAGGRWSTNEQTGTESVSGPLAGPTPTEFETPSKGHVFTYSVAPRWHVDADTMVYARLSTGFRPGGPNVLPAGAPPGVPREYGSDKTTNVELGVKSTLLEGLLSIDVAAFHVDWTNIQLLELVDSFGINGNGGKARSQGLEWTFGYVPVSGLTLNWSGAYTDAKLTSPAPAVHGDTGDPLPYAPKWGTSLDGEYDWAAFADYKAFFGGTWSYVGTRNTDFGSSVDITEQVSLPSYHTYAVRLGLDNDHYRVTLYGQNLADSRGITSYQASGAPGLMGEMGVIQPRTIGVTLSAKF
jgi:outer membrane receptor protein involved in Fe transport